MPCPDKRITPARAPFVRSRQFSNTTQLRDNKFRSGVSLDPKKDWNQQMEDVHVLRLQ
jgi:hypothetical protein